MKRSLISTKEKKGISIREQCELITLNCSTFYYVPKGEKPENLEMIILMDKHILAESTADVLTMQSLLKDKGYKAGYERVRRLMR